MGSDGATALRELRDALRSPIDDVATFTFLLSSTLNTIDLNPNPTSMQLVSSKIDAALTRAVSRQLPSIQVLLLTTHVPTFLPALDTRERQLLQAFFAPPRQSANLALRRAIALTTYSTLSSLLSTKSITPLPRESRSFVLDVLAELTQYGVGDVYWAVWSSPAGSESSKEASARSLEWESAVSALVGLPAKVGNAVGRWKAEGWMGDLPDALSSKYAKTTRVRWCLC
jgi:telomere length regulation protein